MVFCILTRAMMKLILPVSTLAVWMIGICATAQAQAGEVMGTRIHMALAYSQEHGEAATGDLYLPDGKINPRPILLIHGGAWRSMSRLRFAALASALAQRGYAVFNIDYRLLPQAPYPACEEDCIAAANYLLHAQEPELLDLSRKNIMIIGASSGGHLAIMTALKLRPESVAGVVDLSGPADLTAPDIQGLLTNCDFARGHSDAQAVQRTASPVHMQRPTLPPLLVMHSRADTVVPFDQSLRIADFWNRNKGDLHAYFYHGDPNKGHDLWVCEQASPELRPELLEHLLTFLKVCYSAS